MKQDVFTQKNIASYLSKNFIPVVLDIDSDNLPKGFDYYAVPTFYVVGEDGKIINRIVGGANAKQFLEYLKTYAK